MSVCKVSAYRTTDGSLFETEDQAKEYENTNDMYNLLREDLSCVVPKSESLLLEHLTDVLISKGFTKMSRIKMRKRIGSALPDSFLFFSPILSRKVVDHLTGCGWICQHDTIADYMEN